MEDNSEDNSELYSECGKENNLQIPSSQSCERHSILGKSTSFLWALFRFLYGKAQLNYFCSP